MGDVDVRQPGSVAVLVSGGIDSAIMTAELSGSSVVHPLFIRGGLVWEAAELEHLRKFLTAIARPELQPLVVLDQPVFDVYGDHWSTSGREVPDAASPDEAVFLPGRNLFLVTKAAVWCALRGLETLAIGSLAGNPFPDSTPDFDNELAGLVRRAMALNGSFRIVRPFAGLTKAAVVARGEHLRLELTFSCIQPVHGRHCGQCNKCAERRRGFADARLTDRTVYASSPASAQRVS
jgi:7-cyano-7-deazaguanine synthase